MTKKPEKPRVPSSKVPIIGQSKDLASKDRDVALVNTILAQIDPVMQKILEGIDTLERRVAIIEEMVSATVVDILAKKVYDEIQNKFNYPDAQPPYAQLPWPPKKEKE